MYGLIQQDTADSDIKSSLLQSQAQSRLKHTDFEGFKAISGSTINKYPNDYNGLRNAVNPERYESPLKRRLDLPSIKLPSINLRQYNSEPQLGYTGFRQLTNGPIGQRNKTDNLGDNNDQNKNGNKGQFYAAGQN